MNAPTIISKQTRVLYHFTNARFIPAIKEEGLTKGALPWHRCRFTGEPLVIRAWAETTLSFRGVRKMRVSEQRLDQMAKAGNLIAAKHVARLFPGFQWLTSSGDWNQPFALLGELPYAKNSNRITVCVPSEESLGLYRWKDLCEKFNPPSAEELNTSAVDWENWYVFNGRIPSAWFLEIARNPGQTSGPAFLMEGAG